MKWCRHIENIDDDRRDAVKIPSSQLRHGRGAPRLLTLFQWARRAGLSTRHNRGNPLAKNLIK